MYSKPLKKAKVEIDEQYSKACSLIDFKEEEKETVFKDEHLAKQ